MANLALFEIGGFNLEVQLLASFAPAERNVYSNRQKLRNRSSFRSAISCVRSHRAPAERFVHEEELVAINMRPLCGKKPDLVNQGCCASETKHEPSAADKINDIRSLRSGLLSAERSSRGLGSQEETR